VKSESLSLYLYEADLHVEGSDNDLSIVYRMDVLQVNMVVDYDDKPTSGEPHISATSTLNERGSLLTPRYLYQLRSGLKDMAADGADREGYRSKDREN
jgi:hypothetical protein